MLPIASFGPFLAALVMLAITQRRGDVADLLRRLLRWRIGPGWYAAAFLVTTAIAGTAAGINILLGAQVPAGALAEWPEVLLTFLVALLVPGAGGAREEPGWRGFALQGPLARHPALVADALCSGRSSSRGTCRSSSRETPGGPMRWRWLAA